MRTLSALVVFFTGCGPNLPLCGPGVPEPCVRACGDHTQNGDETDVDCGGSCPACEDGKTCVSGSDCQNLACVNRTCAAASCEDGIRNGRETDVDCGRSRRADAGVTDAAPCPRCAVGLGCAVGDDCQGGLCAAGTCTPSLCSDGRKDGEETDVDCGGTFCPKCSSGKTCTDGATDCMSGTCFNSVCR